MNKEILVLGLTRLEAVLCCAVGLLAGWLVLSVDEPLQALATVILATALALITLIDQRHFCIPNVLSLPLIPIGIGTALLLDLRQVGEHAFAALLAASIFLTLRYVYIWYRGIDGLGMGDVKLMTAAGAWVGIDGLAPTILLASIAALMSVLLSRLLGRSSESLGWHTRVPFGSFLAPAILGIWLVRFWL